MAYVIPIYIVLNIEQTTIIAYCSIFNTIIVAKLSGEKYISCLAKSTLDFVKSPICRIVYEMLNRNNSKNIDINCIKLIHL